MLISNAVIQAVNTILRREIRRRRSILNEIGSEEVSGDIANDVEDITEAIGILDRIGKR